MPISEVYLTETVRKLCLARPVTHRKMFGGAGLYCDGVFFAVVDDDRLFFKVDDSNRAQYENAGMEQWVPDAGSGQKMPYFRVPASVIDDPEVLASWIDDAVAVSTRKKKR